MKFKYEMHQHTSPCSHCGKANPEELVINLKAEGFAGCVITDHFYHGNSGVDRNLSWDKFCKPYEETYLKAKAVGDKIDFDVLFGIEEHVGNNKEVLIYGVTPEFMYKYPELREGGREVIYDRVKKENGILIQAHPFRQRDYIQDPFEIYNPDLLDGYEIYNACNRAVDNEAAFEKYGKTDKILIAGSDCHRDTFEGVRAGIETNCRIRNEKELAAVLQSHNFTLFGTDK